VKKLFLVAIVLTLLISACGGQATVTPQTIPVTVQVPVQQTVQVPVLITPTPALPPQVLRWSVEGIGDLDTLDPPRIANSQGVFVASLLFGGLVKLDAELKVVPDAATWTVSETAAVHLQAAQRLRFSDGAGHVRRRGVSLTRALDPAIGDKPICSQHVGADELAAGKAKTGRHPAVDPRSWSVNSLGVLPAS
jgi:hypothetical protein